MTLLSIPNHDIPTHAPFSPAMVRKLSRVATQQPRHNAASERRHVYQVMETRPKCDGWWCQEAGAEYCGSLHEAFVLLQSH